MSGNQMGVFRYFLKPGDAIVSKYLTAGDQLVLQLVEYLVLSLKSQKGIGLYAAWDFFVSFY